MPGSNAPFKAPFFETMGKLTVRTKAYFDGLQWGRLGSSAVMGSGYVANIDDGRTYGQMPWAFSFANIGGRIVIVDGVLVWIPSVGQQGGPIDGYGPSPWAVP